MDTIVPLVILVWLLGLMHLLAHFAAARFAGARVSTLSLGFGPRLFSVTRGGTETRVCVIPFFGRITLAGQSDASLTASPEGQVVTPRPRWQQALIAGSGSLAMLLVAFLLFFGGPFLLGIPEDRIALDTTVGTIVEGYPAAAVLRPGDKILRLSGEPVPRWQDLVAAVQRSERDEVELEVQRDAEIFTTRVGLRNDPNHPRLGVTPFDPPILGTVHVDKNLPAGNAFLRAGDWVQAIDGRRIESWTELEQTIEQSPGRPLWLYIVRSASFEIELAKIPTEQDLLAAYGVTVDSRGKVQSLVPGSKSELVGLMQDDVILSQKEQSVSIADRLLGTKHDQAANSVVIEVQRNHPFELQVVPVRNPIDQKGLLGVERRTETVDRRFDIDASLYLLRVQFEQSLEWLLNPIRMAFEEPPGPGAIALRVYLPPPRVKVADKGLGKLLFLAGLLSLNLGFLTLLPLPSFDGWHVMKILFGDAPSREAEREPIRIV